MKLNIRRQQIHLNGHFLMAAKTINLLIGFAISGHVKKKTKRKKKKKPNETFNSNHRNESDLINNIQSIFINLVKRLHANNVPRFTISMLCVCDAGSEHFFGIVLHWLCRWKHKRNQSNNSWIAKHENIDNFSSSQKCLMSHSHSVDLKWFGDCQLDAAFMPTCGSSCVSLICLYLPPFEAVLRKILQKCRQELVKA